MQIRQILEKHASEPLLITGEDYPASAEKQQLASVISMIQMILISLLPNILPLLITAGLMGFLNIPIKPSTILVFSIGFGI